MSAHKSDDFISDVEHQFVVTTTGRTAGSRVNYFGSLPYQRHRAADPLLHRGEVKGEFEEARRGVPTVIGGATSRGIESDRLGLFRLQEFLKCQLEIPTETFQCIK